MKQKKLLTVAAILLILSTIVVAFVIYTANDDTDPVRVACVGDSITQSTVYPYTLWKLLGLDDYELRNFGVGSTTVALDSQTPYMDTVTFQEALEFQPDIVIIMLGTNDAQPNLHYLNTTFVDDYLQVVNALKALESNPEIWIVMPPPIFDDQSGKISPEYLANTLIPLIEQVAYEADLPTIDVFSVLTSPDYFKDGLHPNTKGGELIAEKIYEAITS